MAKNEIPKYILTLNPEDPSEKFTGTANKIGNVTGPSQDMDSLIQTHKQLLTQYKQDKTNINKDNLIANEKLLFLSINSSINSLDVPKLEELYKLLIDSTNFILEDENTNSAYNGALFIVSKKIPNETKNRLTPKTIPKQKVNTTAQPALTTIPQQEVNTAPILDIKQIVNDTKSVKDLNKEILLSNKITEEVRDKLVLMINEKVNKENNKEVSDFILNAYNALFTELKTREYIKEDGTITDMGKFVLLFWRKILIALIQIAPLNVINNLAILEIVWNSIIEVLSRNSIDSLEEIESNWKKLFQEIKEVFDAKIQEAVAPKIQGDNMVGGGVANAEVILVNNSSDLNVSEFAEPIIYLTSKNPKKIVNFSKIGDKEGKIPVFGYLTVGKQLMLELLDLQTNQRVSFQPEDTKTQQFKKLAMANPALVIGVATYLFNAIVNLGIDKLGFDFYTVKEMVTHVCTSLFGSVAGNILATTTTWFLPDPKTRSSDVGMTAAVKSFWETAVEYGKQITGTGSSSKGPVSGRGGGKKKSRKNIKKLNKKRGSRKVRKSHRKIY